MGNFLAKFFGAGVFFLFLWLAVFNRMEMLIPSAIATVLLFYVIPAVVKKVKQSSDEAKWQKQNEIARIERANQEEQAHQLALRRERERLEMQAEVRVRELIATLEAQYRMDAMKMERLSKIKAEFADRQKADMASLLGQLEAMQAGA